MKVLDRYIVRELLFPIVYCCAALIFLILIADVFDNLDDLLRHGTSRLVILRYYLSLIPFAFIQTIPWAAWLGTLFLLVNFGFHNEIMAMKAAGLKVMSISKPILFLGFLIGIVAFLVGDRMVPNAIRTATELREIYIEKKKEQQPERLYQNVTYYSGGKQLYYFRKFSKQTKTVEGVIALWLDQEEHNKNQKMFANSGKWTGSTWEFEGVTEYQMNSKGRILGEPKTFNKKIYPEIKFSPEELTAATSESAFLSYRELKRWVKKLKENSVRVDSEVVDLHYRLASPWQSLVMMLISIPILAHTTNRKTIALNVLFCVGIVFTFHVTGAIGVALGKAGKMFPFLSAWAGNIAFSILALMNLEKVNH